MPSEQPNTALRRVAVIGAGISGMAAAYELAKDHNVTLFEADTRLGGHARTKMAGRRGDQAVDTGFIVFNVENYPHLTVLFDELDVPVVPSNMSFGASIKGGAFEYGLETLRAVVAQPSNLLNPKFLRMIRDILKFNKHGLRLAQDDGLTVGGLLDRLGAGRYFRDFYLLPLSGAIWSTPTQKIMDFPAKAMMTFFENHALLGVTGQHQWFTVKGGSQNYVTRLGAAMTQRGVEIRLGAQVTSVQRDQNQVRILCDDAAWDSFDEVIFATHSDDSLRLLADPSDAEAAMLGAVKYQPNTVVLHSDTSIMPKRKSVWSSWVYTEDTDKVSDRIDLTYWMNKLQPWLQDDPLFVTLNSTRDIDPALIWDEVTLRHPVYDLGALAAQKEAALMNGQNRTWFCGAWMKNGFHEDGIASAMDVATSLRARDALALAAE